MPEKSKIRAAIDRHLPTTFASTSISMAIVITTMLMWEETGLTRWQVQAGELEQRIEATEQSLDEIAHEQRSISNDVNDIEVKLGAIEADQKNFNKLQQRVLDRLEEIGPR